MARLGALVAAILVGLVSASSSDSEPTEHNVNSFFWDMNAATSESSAGFSWYTNIFELFQEGHALDMQMGMGGTWLNGRGIEFGNTCACNPQGWPSSPKVAPHDPSNGCCNKAQRCGWLYETFEGGPGYWGNELPTANPKWRAGSTVGCYKDCANSPMWCGAGPAKACDSMAMAVLSNQMLFTPDGVTLDRTGMLGVGYLRTPFGKVDPNDNRNHWTIVLDAENFAGPLGYFLPEYWAERAKGWEKQSAHLKDIGTATGLTMGGDAFEWNTIQTFKDEDGNYKLPKMSIPYHNGRGVLTMVNRGYEDAEVSVPLEQALQTGTLEPEKVMASGSTANCRAGTNSAIFNVEGDTHFQVGTLKTSIEDGDCVWSIKMDNASCSRTSDCSLPQYISRKLQPTDASRVTSALRNKGFPRKSGGRAYDALSSPPAGGCMDSPGPALSTLFCVQTRSPSWVAWKWYKFVDQPAMVRAKLSDSQRAFMQKRVETMHKMVKRESRWIKSRGAAAVGLAAIDSALFVTPPKGMEYGFVPVVLYEGLSKPKHCNEPDRSPINAMPNEVVV